MTSWLTVCIYLPHLMIEVARLRQPTERPLAVAAAASDRAPIIDCDARAGAAGVQVGMPVLTARRLCRDLEVNVADRVATAQVATQIAAVLGEYAEDGRRSGADCWTARAVALGHDYRAAPSFAETLQATIASTIGVACQVGLARTTIVASIAARIARPTRVVLPDTEVTFLAPLPVGRLPGVGTKTIEALRGLGITTIGQVQMLSASALAQICGNRGRAIARLALGRDGTAPPDESASITTRWLAAGEPEADLRRLHAHLHRLTAQAGRELRSRDLAAGELSIRVVWSDGSHSQRIERDAARCNLDARLSMLARHALDTLLQERRLAVRALTLALSDFGARQIDLFAAADDRPHQLQHALDRLAVRYGPQAVLPGSLVGLLPATS